MEIKHRGVLLLEAFLSFIFLVSPLEIFFSFPKPGFAFRLAHMFLMSSFGLGLIYDSAVVEFALIL